MAFVASDPSQCARCGGLMSFDTEMLYQTGGAFTRSRCQTCGRGHVYRDGEIYVAPMSRPTPPTRERHSYSPTARVRYREARRMQYRLQIEHASTLQSRWRKGLCGCGCGRKCVSKWLTGHQRAWRMGFEEAWRQRLEESLDDLGGDQA